MNSAVVAVTEHSAEAMLRSVIESGVRLVKTDNQLSYRTVDNSVSHNEIHRLAGATKEILTVLRSISGEQGCEATPSQRVDYAPLGFSQLVHWNLHQLMGKKSLRVAAPAIRLNGAINIQALKATIEALIVRHEALRTRIGLVDGAPIQVIQASTKWHLDMYDITEVPEHVREMELQSVIEKYVLEPIDATRDPLFATALIRLSADEHVLLLAMDHLISDGTSVNILLREFSEIYDCIIENRQLSLPAIRVQFADYAVWQKSMYKLWLIDHERNSALHLTGCQSAALPMDELSSKSKPGLGFARLKFHPRLRGELVNWSRARRTTMALGVFCAFVALVLRWYRTSDAIVQYQTNGRYSPEVQNTLGYFAFRLFLRIRLDDDDTFVDLLKRVQEEFATAYEHKEFGSMQVYSERGDVTGSPCFNWLTLDPIEAKSNCDFERDKIKYSRVRYADRITNVDDVKTDTELMTLISDEDNEIRGAVQFSRQTTSLDAMERFGRNFALFIQALLSNPDMEILKLQLV